jgi:uncharacterized membrane protein YgdD (TMEM256/DUF423 family)
MHKGFIRAAAIMGLLAVILGAFGAHALKQMVSAESVATFETGVRYQFYHTFGLLAVAILFDQFSSKMLRYAGISFIIGTVLFSGSLYLLTFLNAAGDVGLRKIGIVTPIGGLFFIAGWLCLFLGVRSAPQK